MFNTKIKFRFSCLIILALLLSTPQFSFAIPVSHNSDSSNGSKNISSPVTNTGDSDFGIVSTFHSAITHNALHLNQDTHQKNTHHLCNNHSMQQDMNSDCGQCGYCAHCLGAVFFGINTMPSPTSQIIAQPNNLYFSLITPPHIKPPRHHRYFHSVI